VLREAAIAASTNYTVTLPAGFDLDSFWVLNIRSELLKNS
jgi:hypothetical protein